MKLKSVTFIFRSGADEACLFTDLTLRATKTADGQRFLDGHDFVDAAPCTVTVNPTGLDATTSDFDLLVFGSSLTDNSTTIDPDDNSSYPILLNPNEGFRVNIAAIPAGGITAVLQIVEKLIFPRENSCQPTSAHLAFSIAEITHLR